MCATASGYEFSDPVNKPKILRILKTYFYERENFVHIEIRNSKYVDMKNKREYGYWYL